MRYTIATIDGDGIGPETMGVGTRVLRTSADVFGFGLEFLEVPAGGAAYDQFGTPYPKETKDACIESDAIFLSAIGGPKWEDLPPEKKPERGFLFPVRSDFDLFANIRPAKAYRQLSDASPLKNEVIDGSDILVVRELTGGIYFGNEKVKELILKIPGGEAIVPAGHFSVGRERYGLDVMVYSQSEIERITRVACDIAMQREKRLTSIDKANALASSELWREVVSDFVAENYPEIELDHLYVDAGAMKLVGAPRDLDVLLAGNIFGDILSDEAGALTGSLGMLPSASLNSEGFGLYEPVHGSAPDIAGQGKANPIGTVLSGAMLLRHSLNEKEAADAIERAVIDVLGAGYRTEDIAKKGYPTTGTEEMGDLICKCIERNRLLDKK
jgi:3-isopropylmalate dehydrogenase